MFAQKNNGRLLFKLGLVLAVLAVAGALMFRRFDDTARVKVVNRDVAVDAVTGSATVFADGGYREVRSEAAGKVKRAGAIDKDAYFKAGAPLVELDTTDLDRQIEREKRENESRKEKIKIQLEDDPREKVLKAAYETAKRLHGLGDYSDEQLKTAQRALEGHQRQLKLDEFDRKKADDDFDLRMKDLQILRDKMTIPAPPFDGQVREPNTWEGALIGAAQQVAVVFSNKRIVSAKISEESFGKVKLGQKARLRLLAHGNTLFEAKVSKLLTTADEAQRFEVYLDVQVEDPQVLRPGSTGEVTITVAERPNAILIPRRALFAGDKVWVVKNGRVQRRQVKIGFDSAMNVVEIVEGIDAGEQIIVDRLEEYYDGQRVRAQVVE